MNKRSARGFEDHVACKVNLLVANMMLSCMMKGVHTYTIDVCMTKGVPHSTSGFEDDVVMRDHHSFRRALGTYISASD